MKIEHDFKGRERENGQNRRYAYGSQKFCIWIDL